MSEIQEPSQPQPQPQQKGFEIVVPSSKHNATASELWPGQARKVEVGAAMKGGRMAFMGDTIRGLKDLRRARQMVKQTKQFANVIQQGLIPEVTNDATRRILDRNKAERKPVDVKKLKTVHDALYTLEVDKGPDDKTHKEIGGLGLLGATDGETGPEADPYGIWVGRADRGPGVYEFKPMPRPDETTPTETPVVPPTSAQ